LGRGETGTWRRCGEDIRNPQPLAPPGRQNIPPQGQRYRVKIFLFIRISDYRIESYPNPAEGRIAIVTNAGWDVVDAGGVGARVVAGRITP
jgi:hypothetical protein